MSIFMAACMASLFFRLMPPESYITPLPTIARWPVGLDGPVRQLDHARRFGAAGVDAEQPAAAERGERLGVERSRSAASTRPATAVATSAIRLAVRCPGGVLARSRASWAAPAVTSPRAPPRSTAPALRGTADEGDRTQPDGRHLLLQRAVAVAGEEDPLDDGLGGDVGGEAADVGERGGQGAVLGGGAGERGGHVAQLRGASSVGGVADADRDDDAAALARHDERLADLAVEPRRRQRRPVEPELTRHGTLHADGDADGVGRAGIARATATVTSPARATDGVGSNVATVSVSVVVTVMAVQSAPRRRRRAPAASSRPRRHGTGPSSTAGPTAG